MSSFLFLDYIGQFYLAIYATIHHLLLSLLCEVVWDGKS